MRNFFLLSLLATMTLFTGAVIAEQTPAAKAAAAKPAAKPPIAAKTLPGSSYRLTGTIKDIMEGIVDPASDVLFESVSTDITASGVKEKRPETDEEWAAVEGNALMLAEATNLLKMPGRIVARPGENTVSEGPDAPELSPAQISAKIAADRAKFVRYANGLQEAALKALNVARRRDVEGLFNVGEDIDMACENCHLEYWYPNDKAAVAAAREQSRLKAADEKAKAAAGRK